MRGEVLPSSWGSCFDPQTATARLLRITTRKKAAGNGKGSRSRNAVLPNKAQFAVLPVAGRSICRSLLLFYLFNLPSSPSLPATHISHPGEWPGHVCVAQLVSGATDGVTDEAIQFWQCGVDMD